MPVLRNGLLVLPVQHLDSILRRLVTTTEEATVVIPEWTNTSWCATAVRACFEYQVLVSADARDTTPTPWAMLACHFLHRYDDEQDTKKLTTSCQTTNTNQTALRDLSPKCARGRRPLAKCATRGQKSGPSPQRSHYRARGTTVNGLISSGETGAKALGSERLRCKTT